MATVALLSSLEFEPRRRPDLESGSHAAALHHEAQKRLRRNGLHFLISTSVEDVRPNTSGSYISSTFAGAVMNIPAVVARSK